MLQKATPRGKRALRRERRRLAQARWRANVQNCAAIYPLPLDAKDLNWLIDDVRYLREADAADKVKVADAVRRMIKDAQR
jgi:hypothetical protein